MLKFEKLTIPSEGLLSQHRCVQYVDQILSVYELVTFASVHLSMILVNNFGYFILLRRMHLVTPISTQLRPVGPKQSLHLQSVSVEHFQALPRLDATLSHKMGDVTT